MINYLGIKMIETLVLLLAVIFITVYLASSSASAKFFSEKKTNKITDIKRQIPEDSTLKRHFLTNLRAQIESEFHSRPTDAVLKRHYDSLITSKVEDYLKLSVV